VNETTPDDRGLSLFERRLLVVALSLLLVFLSFHLLRELAVLFQPLLIAALITYMALPMHRWLVRKGVPKKLAHVVLVIGVIVFFYAVGRLAQDNFRQLSRSWPEYEGKLNDLLKSLHQNMPFPITELEDKQVRDLIPPLTAEQVTRQAQILLDSFTGFLTTIFVVILYLVFLAAEIFSFPQRAREAFGDHRGERVMQVIDSINHAVGGYLAVMTFINLMIAAGTFILLVLFRIPFAPLWALLMFLFAYIPYIGTVLVTGAILLLTVIVYSHAPWTILVVTVLLVALQQVFGAYVQPRMMGTRLGVSPLLILLSLSFWGIVWGIVGMLLAVPLLMVLKISLENIPETKPLAVLMSNP
jgi:AI-2 transport protein TqsA